MDKDILLAVVMILLGPASIWFIKNHPSKRDLFLNDKMAYIGGVCCIIIGVLALYKAIGKYI
jgi:hypothetical protein